MKFAGWTDAGHLRAPVFVRLRDDIDPKTVKRQRDCRVPPRRRRLRASGEVDQVLQQLEDKRTTLQLAIGAARIKLTHLDRVYWPADPGFDQPALTKRDLLRYLARVSPFMLPHLADRPLTMIRMPEGIDGERFFQKHWQQARPEFVQTVKVFSETKDESHEYLLCNDLATLLWVAQSGTLEFHVWHSRCRPGPDAKGAGTDFASSSEAMDASVLNRPDYLVFDIDPYIYSGKEAKGRRAGAEHQGVREGQGGGVLAARAAAEHGARVDREDLRQDRPARLRADRADARLRRGAAGLRDGGPAPSAPAPARTSRWTGR